METRLQTQEIIQQLLNGIAGYNKSKIRDYYKLSTDIQRDYLMDDYMYIVSHIENHSNILGENDVDLHEMSDDDIIKLEQVLRYTSDFLGLSTAHIHQSTEYRAIEVDLSSPGPLWLTPTNQLDILHYLLDPIKFLLGGQTTRKSFPEMSTSEQMDYLRKQYREGMSKTGRARGGVAAHLRSLRNDMKLNGLFNSSSENYHFMNVDLRDFLNLNEDGTEMYTWNDVHQTGWREVLSFGSQKHQLTAPDTTTSIIIGYYNNNLNAPIYRDVYVRLNAKFCHNDGREVVFAYKSANDGVLITDYPDKGTFNYGDDKGNDLTMGAGSIKIGPIIEGDHYKYDMEPYDEYINELKKNDDFKRKIEELTRQNGGDKFNPTTEGNSYFWRFD